MKKLLTIITILFLFTGCSGKKVYETAMDFGRYQSDLTLKQTTISNNLNVSYLENNIPSDKTLILIHGFGANKDNWLNLANKLNGKYHLIILDLIGDGESSKPFNIDYTINTQTKMLHEFLNTFKKKNFVLVGNSMGGQIALNYAYHYKIDSLIVIDPMGIKVEDSFVDKLGRKKLEEIYLNVCTVEKMEKMMEIGFTKPPYVPNFILEYLTQEKCKVSKLDAYKYKGLYDNNLNLLDDMTEKSKKINIPTLILWGKEDKVISVKNAYALNKYIKNSKLIIFDNIGHMPMLEDAELTVNSIIEFLSNEKQYNKYEETNNLP